MIAELLEYDASRAALFFFRRSLCRSESEDKDADDA
jgi:hypothetical protein